MNILLSADYHIKLKTKNIPDEWAKNRFRALFAKLQELEETVDLHIVAGDFFDKVPTLEELELYYEFVAGRKCETIEIPGNHEALKKDTTFFSYLKSITNKLNSKVRIIDDFHTEYGIDFIPYNRLKQYHPADIDFHSKILVTHVRGEIPPHVKPEVNLDIFNRWEVVLAGDLHSYDNSQRNILYPGSPITTSFHRSKVDTGVIIIDTDTLEHRFIPLELPQLIRKTIKAGEPMIATHPDHTIYEIEGDIVELAEVSDHELIDKKVTKRDNDTALILSPEMSIEEEITDYLTYILGVSPDTVGEVLKLYHDYAKEFKME
jgi:DNA repair exonuclease SbcCD nuclease subunit